MLEELAGVTEGLPSAGADVLQDSRRSPRLRSSLLGGRGGPASAGLIVRESALKASMPGVDAPADQERAAESQQDQCEGATGTNARRTPVKTRLGARAVGAHKLRDQPAVQQFFAASRPASEY